MYVSSFDLRVVAKRELASRCVVRETECAELQIADDVLAVTAQVKKEEHAISGGEYRTAVDSERLVHAHDADRSSLFASWFA